MIKKYSTSNIGSIYKISNKMLKCIKCGINIELSDEISIDSLISPENKDPLICEECKSKGKII